MSPSSDRAAIGRIGAHTKWANTQDRTAATAPARAVLEAKFLAESDGDPLRAASLRKAYFARLSLASAKARRARALNAKADVASAELDALAAGSVDDVA